MIDPLCWPQKTTVSPSHEPRYVTSPQLPFAWHAAKPSSPITHFSPDSQGFRTTLPDAADSQNTIVSPSQRPSPVSAPHPGVNSDDTQPLPNWSSTSAQISGSPLSPV